MIDDVLEATMTNDIFWDQANLLFDDRFDLDSFYAKTNFNYFRSALIMAGPLDINGVRYTSSQDRRVEQELFVGDFSLKINDLALEYTDAQDNLEMYAFSLVTL